MSRDKNLRCSICSHEEDCLKKLKRINGTKLCKKCYQENRSRRRKETIQSSGIKRELMDLKNQEEKNKRRLTNPTGRRGRPKIDKIPMIKGGRDVAQKNLSSSYLSLQEKQVIYKLLTSRGLDHEEAKERIKDLVKEQNRVRKEMLSSGRSETDITNKQQELLEELWNL